ncbi:hypothetical protein [Glutamicibacter sp.]|uniref:hypothetical protein n=1 Tax=Glutamicibacter sp. TaxID=1931995 RepID=UPI0028BD9189|nr:hypothetical protein [Glutamicibacter sp.]
MAGSVPVLPAVKVFWRYFGEAQMDFQGIDRDLFIEAAARSIVLVVCLPLSTFKWTEARCVPLTVLEILFNPAAGPLGFFGLGNSIQGKGYRPADGHRPRCCTARGECSRSTTIPA